MLKLAANSLKSRGNVSGQSLFRNYNAQNALMGSASFSTFGQSEPKASTSDRVHAAFELFKGKAALGAEPVAPTFSENEAGGVFIKRSGSIMLSFTPSKGDRKYDWERKQRFCLSATEVGAIISMSPTGSCDFFHDPALKSSNAGQVRKSLKISGPSDGSNYFFTLTVNDAVKKINERLAVAVSPAEFSVLRTAFSYALPHILGWDRYASKLPSSTGQNYSKPGNNYSKPSQNYSKPSQSYTKPSQTFAKPSVEDLDSEWEK